MEHWTPYVVYLDKGAGFSGWMDGRACGRNIVAGGNESMFKVYHEHRRDILIVALENVVWQSECITLRQ